MQVTPPRSSPRRAAATAAATARPVPSKPLDEPELHYALDLLPPGRFPFRRWRWELWHGSLLLATGWRTSEHHAERALGTAALRFAHRRLGLTPLRPEAAAPAGSLGAGRPVRIQSGAVACRLVPRRVQADAA